MLGVFQCKNNSLKKKIFRNSRVSLRPTLSRNEQVEQHRKKKTQKHITIRFLVGDNIIVSYMYLFIIH